VQFNLEGNYVWHCHILSHEEHDMMRPLVVTAPAASTSSITAVFSSTLVAETESSETERLLRSETQAVLKAEQDPLDAK
jgi:hypothetical protein